MKRAWWRTGISETRAPSPAASAAMKRCMSEYRSRLRTTQRRYALSEQPVSWMRAPVTLAIRKFATFDGSSRVATRSWRLRRHPSHTLLCNLLPGVGAATGKGCRFVQIRAYLKHLMWMVGQHR